ncbi:hypothetical protein V8F33_012062 [Rhypophila sp. PSN 637]
MKIPTVLSLFGGISSVSAYYCYNEGHRPALNTMTFHFTRACEGYSGIAGAFQGWFAPNQEKYACVDLGSNVKLEMWVRNQNPTTGFDLGDTDCTKEFNNIMHACFYGFGGHNDVAGWYFRIDPNEGTC